MLSALAECVSTMHRRLAVRARMVKAVLKIADKSLLGGLGLTPHLWSQVTMLTEAEAKKFKDLLSDPKSRVRHMSWDDLSGKKEQGTHTLTAPERSIAAEYCAGEEWESSDAFVAGGVLSKDAKKLKPFADWLHALQEAAQMLSKAEEHSSAEESHEATVKKFAAKIGYPKPDETKMNKEGCWG
eukprot:1859269-Rhodomonas_salina.1